MDSAKALVRTVARTFYDVEHIVVIDSVVNHSALTIEDLKQIFAAGGRQPKEIAKYLGKLRESGLLSCYGRQETKPGAQKATTVEYWWIDYQFAVDAIKFRLHMVEEQLSRVGKQTTEKKEYFCIVCKSEWTALEVMDNVDPSGIGSGFRCKRCNHPLKYRPPNEEDGRSEGSNLVSQFNTQLSIILNLVESIDRLQVPVCTPESAIENIKPVPKMKEIGALELDLPDLPKSLPTSVKGIRAQAENVEIVLDTDSARTAAAQQAEADRRAKILAQNQLPEWHTKSTISGDATGRGSNNPVDHLDNTFIPKAGSLDNKTAGIDNNAMDKFFENLQAEQAEKAEHAQANDNESDEESDEDEFEDVKSPVLKKPKLESPVESTAPTSVTGPEVEDDSEEEEFEDV